MSCRFFTGEHIQNVGQVPTDTNYSLRFYYDFDYVFTNFRIVVTM